MDIAGLLTLAEETVPHNMAIAALPFSADKYYRSALFRITDRLLLRTLKTDRDLVVGRLEEAGLWLILIEGGMVHPAEHCVIFDIKGGDEFIERAYDVVPEQVPMNIIISW